MILLLAACGIDEDALDQPLPPPAPPPALVNEQPDVVQQSGLVSDVYGPTRTFVLTGEGKRTIVHLRDTATLKVGGKPILVADLPAGTTLYVEGKRFGDFLLASAAADARTEPKVAADAAAPAAAAPADRKSTRLNSSHSSVSRMPSSA